VARGLLPKLRYSEVLTIDTKTWGIDGFRLVPEAYEGPEPSRNVLNERLLRMDVTGNTMAKLYQCLAMAVVKAA
jgi:hypothetical protein